MYTDTEILDWIIKKLLIVDKGIVSDSGCGCCAKYRNTKLQNPREALSKAMDIWDDK